MTRVPKWNESSFSRSRATEILTTIAREMKREGNTLFLIEQLQPTWLGKGRTLTTYTLITRLVVAVFLGLSVLPLLFIALGASGIDLPMGEVERLERLPVKLPTPPDLTPANFAERLLWLLPLSLTVSLITGLFSHALDGWRLSGGRIWVWAGKLSPRKRVPTVLGIYFLAMGLPASVSAPWIISWVERTLSTPLISQPLWAGPHGSAIMSLLAASVMAPLWAFRASELSLAGDVRLLENLGWSWPRALAGAANGVFYSSLGLPLLLVGFTPAFKILLPMILSSSATGWILFAGSALLLRPRLPGHWRPSSAGRAGAKIFAAVGLVGGLLTLGWPYSANVGVGPPEQFAALLADLFFSQLTSSYASWWPLAASCGAACGFFLGGLRGRVEERARYPSRGIHLSLTNSLKATWPLALITLLLIILLSLRSLLSLPINVPHVTLTGILAAAIGGFHFLWFGSLDALNHYTLRILLWRKRRIPLQLPLFLDYAAEELGFLQKVGGGYIFIHRYLLEYFAGLGQDEAPVETREPPSTQQQKPSCLDEVSAGNARYPEP